MFKSLFFKQLLKILLVYLFCHLVSSFFMSEIMSLSGKFGSFIQSILLIVLILSPACVLFSNVTLVPNFSWMMTSFKSKKEIFTYFLLSQTVVVVASVLPALFYLLIPDYGFDEKNISDDFSFFDFLPDFWWDYPLLIICVFTFLYVIPLSVGVLTKGRRGNLKLYLLFCFLFPFAIMIKKFFESYFFFSGLSFAAVLFYFMYYVLIRFNLVSDKRRGTICKFSILFSVIFYLIIGVGVNRDVLNEELPLKHRLAAMENLGSLSPTLSVNQQKRIFTQIETGKELRSFFKADLELENKILINKTFDVMTTKNRKFLVLSLIDLLNKNDFSSLDVALLLKSMENEIGRADYSWQVYKRLSQVVLVDYAFKTKIKDEELERLFLKKTSFTDYIALEYLRLDPKMETQEKWLMKYKDVIKPERVQSHFSRLDQSLPKAYQDFIDSRSQ